MVKFVKLELEDGSGDAYINIESITAITAAELDPQKFSSHVFVVCEEDPWVVKGSPQAVLQMIGYCEQMAGSNMRSPDHA